MKLFVYVFDDNYDAAERCFRDMRSVTAADVAFNDTPLTDGKLGFQVMSVGTEPIQVLVSFSSSMNEQELEREIDQLHEILDLVLVDDHYGFNPLAGQSVILPLLVSKLRRHANMLPVFCLFTEHYEQDKARLASFMECSDKLLRAETIITGIPKDSARLLEVVRWSAILKRAAQAASGAQALVRAAGLDRTLVSGPAKAKPAGLRDKVEDSAWLTSESGSMKAVQSLAQRYAKSNSYVLILGERGTGKTAIAKVIHSDGPRRNGPFVKIDLGKISEQLFESELFGHEDGAFSGAKGRRKGLLETAEGGTVFLDEVGNTPLAQQRRLLAFLDDGNITPVGSNEPRHLNVRVVAATNRDLEQMVREGLFMADLFDRLWELVLEVPPLRDRGDDIVKLASHFAHKHIKDEVSLSRELVAATVRFNWPGNVRQLENMIKRAGVLLDEHETVLQLSHFPDLTAAEQGRPAGEAELKWVAPSDLGPVDWKVMTEYASCVLEFCRTRGSMQGVTLKEVGLFAYKYKLGTSSQDDCAKQSRQPEKAFMNHLNNNSVFWARFLFENRALLDEKVFSVFFLSKGIKSEYQSS